MAEGVGLENSQGTVQARLFRLLRRLYVPRGVPSLGDAAVGEELVDRVDGIVPVRQVGALVGTLVLALARELALQTDFVSSGVDGNAEVAQAVPLVLEVANGLVAVLLGLLPATDHPRPGRDLALVFGEGREHTAPSCPPSASADALGFDRYLP